MKKWIETLVAFLFAVLLATLISGCAWVHSSTLRTTDPKSGIITEKTSATGYALFDANSNLSKFRNSSGTNGGTYVSGLNESASSTNVVAILHELGNIAGQAAAAAAK